ncbi:hypothetical protein KEM55_002604 [Ascosphaera atra]|nr:hypothetical protein KEM55_002604 [Ascosphaera atra]
MSKIVEITSPTQFDQILGQSKLVVVDFTASWCGPCKAIAPAFEQLANKFTKANEVAFLKVDVDAQQSIAARYGVSAMPTFLFFKNGKQTDTVRGADVGTLVNKTLTFVDSTRSGGDSGSGSSASAWLGAPMPRGHAEINEAIDIKQVDALNYEKELGDARTILASTKPSALDAKGKGKDKAGDNDSKTEKKDWMESDTDEQLMIHIPFGTIPKLHSIQLTSLPPADDEDVMRPRKLKLFTNRSTMLGFEDADEETPEQEIEIQPEQWDEKTGTVTLELRYVKFQRISSLTIYVVDGDGDGEKTRIDRLRLFGDAGPQGKMGSLQKIGDEPGE